MIKHNGIRVPMWSIVLQILGWTLLKIRITSKKFQIKAVRNWILSKKVPERLCLSHPRVELGGSKNWQVWSIVLKGKSKLRSTLGLNAAKNTHRIKKKLQIKVVRNWISSKKVRDCICQSSPEKLGGSKDW